MLYWCEIGNCGMGPLSDGAVHQSSWEKIWRKYSFQTEERTNGNKKKLMYNQPPTLLRSGNIKIIHQRNSYMIIDLWLFCFAL